MSSKHLDGPAMVSLATPDQRIVVHFIWCEDRFGHRIYVDGVANEVASTVDGEGTEDWPSSPPLQQLSQEVIDGRPVVLGIGLAGRSHWSVVVQSIVTETGHAMKFEWACRHKAKPQFVGSTYQLTAAVEVNASANAKRMHRDPRTLVIEPNQTCISGTDVWTYEIS